ncbi:RnfH family protein [Pseudomonas sp. KNUC1026]|uniref:RnfH family protein n=1 Tax=Pseudomonas sp. KNUC1026 TaxID=2893890 RepID=UPI001F2C990C|nr:RnfH family protein [Pseudomonas sp. KNUC1026]UFH49965.1 RnfH family protein [Pseudomonas sp. KNUC1026]
MAERSIKVEVAHAGVAEQALIALEVPEGCTATQAIQRSGILQRFVGLDTSAVGIFGKLLKAPASHVLEPGDRVEIYRPLLADPMEVRRQRAARAKAKAAQAGKR